MFIIRVVLEAKAALYEKLTKKENLPGTCIWSRIIHSHINCYHVCKKFQGGYNFVAFTDNEDP